jgi:nuclear pore complex protein Nup155
VTAAASSQYSDALGQPWEPFYLSAAFDFPSQVFNEYEGMFSSNIPSSILQPKVSGCLTASNKSTSHMGLFPEIDRAWVVIDNKLILWEYSSGDHLHYETPEIINTVALVKAKPGIFIDEITHVLVLCTDNTVHLVGLQAVPTFLPQGQVRKEISIFATGLEVTTEGVEMFGVVGTSDGRIFMCGGKGDGCLYELTYQGKESWFSKRCSLINHSLGAVAAFIPSLLATKASGMSTTLSSLSSS